MAQDGNNTDPLSMFYLRCYWYITPCALIIFITGFRKTIVSSSLVQYQKELSLGDNSFWECIGSTTRRRSCR